MDDRSSGHRIFWPKIIGLALVLVVAVWVVLWLADRFASNADTYCSTNLPWWALLEWLGCAMAAHEELSAGLIGAAGALFSGWLAFFRGLQ
jgi:hypothetical protein